MIFPDPRANISFPNSRARMNAASRLIDRTRSQYSSECSCRRLPKDHPRIVDQDIHRPSRSPHRRDQRIHRRPIRQINPIRREFPPIARISFSTSLPDASEADTPMISAPASANASAIDRPIPLLQPVTNAVFPCKLNRLRIRPPIIYGNDCTTLPRASRTSSKPLHRKRSNIHARPPLIHDLPHQLPRSRPQAQPQHRMTRRHHHIRKFPDPPDIR